MTGQIIFTGTSSAMAEPKRFHSSFIINHNDYFLLVDAGDGISKAVLESGIHIGMLNGVLITHRHADHWSGLPSLLTQLNLIRRTVPFTIFAHESDLELLKDYLHSSYLFDERMNFIMEYISFTAGSTFSPDEGFLVSAFANSHLEKYRRYDTSGKAGFFSGSFLFSCCGVKVYYTGDIGSEEDLYLTDEQPDIYITECSHVSEAAIRGLAKKYESATIVMTHYSVDQGFSLVSLADKNPVSSIKLAFEGMRIDLKTLAESEKGKNSYV